MVLTGKKAAQLLHVILCNLPVRVPPKQTVGPFKTPPNGPIAVETQAKPGVGNVAEPAADGRSDRACRPGGARSGPAGARRLRF